MKSIKLLLLICVAINFSQCKSMKLTASAPFNVTGATYHSWVGGQPGVSGTNVIIRVSNDTDITFKKIYFQNKVVDVTTEDRNGKKYVVANISTSTRKEAVIGNNDSAVKSKPTPFELSQNEAVVSYISGKKTYYYKVSRIKKTETIFYP